MRIQNVKYKTRKKYKTVRGFTLIEVLVLIGILVGIFLVIGAFMNNIVGLRNYFGESLTVEQELEQTLAVMRQEIRSMGPSNIGNYPIQQASQNELIFFSDVDKDGVFERVRYFLNGTTLMRGIVEPSGSPYTYDPGDETTRESVHNVIAATNIFSYFDDSYTGTESAMSFPVNVADIRVVRATITAGENRPNGPAPVTLSVQGTIRNLRTNL